MQKSVLGAEFKAQWENGNGLVKWKTLLMEYALLAGKDWASKEFMDKWKVLAVPGEAIPDGRKAQVEQEFRVNDVAGQIDTEKTLINLIEKDFVQVQYDGIRWYEDVQVPYDGEKPEQLPPGQQV